jgi:hypothetical protein
VAAAAGAEIGCPRERMSRLETGTRRVTPKETDKRQPLQSVLWKVESNGRKIIK